MNMLAFNAMREENASSFMLFACFGIASADDRREVIASAIDRAYRDAAAHVLSFEAEDKKKTTNAVRRKAAERIQKAIEELTSCQRVYDDWHKELIKDLKGIYDGHDLKKGYEFTYGVAQKWVNMTMKYLYIIDYFCHSLGYENTDFQLAYDAMIRKYCEDFHVPIDGYIMKAAKKEFGVKSSFSAWSKIESYEAYFSFQEAIRTHPKFRKDPNCALNYSPIDWEGPAWIEYALEDRAKQKRR